MGQSREWTGKLQHGVTGDQASPGVAPGRCQAPDGLCSPSGCHLPPTMRRFPPRPRPSPMRSLQLRTLFRLPFACLRSTPPSGSRSRSWPSEDLPWPLASSSWVGWLCSVSPVTPPLNFDPFHCSPSKKGTELCLALLAPRCPARAAAPGTQVDWALEAAMTPENTLDPTRLPQPHTHVRRPSPCPHSLRPSGLRDIV